MIKVRNLAGLHVLVTRPQQQGKALCAAIEACGGHAVHFPTIAFAPPLEPEIWQHALATLEEQDWLIFVSPQAVYSSMPAIRRVWISLPAQSQLAAVGAGTAKALTEAGYRVAASPEHKWGSEGLLELPVFQTIQDKKIAIFRGEEGREHLHNELLARGAIVSHVVSYRRVVPLAEVNDFKHYPIDVIICTSFEGVKNLKIMWGAENWPGLKSRPLVVVSERIKMLAHDLGFQTIWVAQNASHETILDVLAQRRNEL